jgi:small subunit ribosomal protein S24e
VLEVIHPGRANVSKVRSRFPVLCALAWASVLVLRVCGVLCV